MYVAVIKASCKSGPQQQSPIGPASTGHASGSLDQQRAEIMYGCPESGERVPRYCRLGGVRAGKCREPWHEHLMSFAHDT
eukprot:13398119-Alexandrium_andersonii.AAC.1